MNGRVIPFENDVEIIFITRMTKHVYYRQIGEEFPTEARFHAFPV
jgi:hypothetical protein